MRKLLFVSLAIISAQTFASAQWSQSMFNSPNQQLVEDAVRKGIILVRQDYQLRDTLTNQKYGRNHETNFGTVYSIAAIVQNALSVSDRFVSPWEYDSNYDHYRSSQYQPIISKTLIRDVADSTYTELQYGKNNIRALKDGIVYYVDSLSHPDRGFIIDHSKGEKDGWLVWVFTNDTTRLTNASLSLVTYKYKATIEEGLNKYSVKQPTVSGRILGGVYVCPRTTTIGTLEFMFEGLIIPDENDNGQFYYFFDTTDDLTRSISEATTEAENILTPITDDSVQDRNTRRRSRNRNR